MCVNLVPHFHTLTSLHVLIYVIPGCYTRENCHFKRQKKKGELGTLVLLTNESLTLITVPAICHYVCLQLMRTATKY